MITFGRTSTKPNFLFGKFPNYFKENDSGSKVVSGYEGDGFLERYLEIFCMEVDEEVSTPIDELLDITNASALSGLSTVDPEDLLTHITELFGNPPDVGTGESYSGDSTEYIVLIRYIRQILQTKGTTQALIYFLAIYGYEISTLIDADSSENVYDESPTVLEYDASHVYDVGFSFFSTFSLSISTKAGITHSPTPTQAWLDDYLKPAIQNFIAPIWATLETITYVP